MPKVFTNEQRFTCKINIMHSMWTQRRTADGNGG